MPKRNMLNCSRWGYKFSMAGRIGSSLERSSESDSRADRVRSVPKFKGVTGVHAAADDCRMGKNGMSFPHLVRDIRQP